MKFHSNETDFFQQLPFFSFPFKITFLLLQRFFVIFSFNLQIVCLFQVLHLKKTRVSQLVRRSSQPTSRSVVFNLRELVKLKPQLDFIHCYFRLISELSICTFSFFWFMWVFVCVTIYVIYLLSFLRIDTIPPQH